MKLTNASFGGNDAATITLAGIGTLPAQVALAMLEIQSTATTLIPDSGSRCPQLLAAPTAPVGSLKGMPEVVRRWLAPARAKIKRQATRRARRIWNMQTRAGDCSLGLPANSRVTDWDIS